MSMRKGDRVRVTTAPWAGELGVIEHVNGGYHIVRMDKSVHKDDVHEFYANEIEPSRVPPPNVLGKVTRGEDLRNLYHVSYTLDVMVVAESLREATKIAAENVSEEFVNLDTSLPDQANLASYIPAPFGPHDDPWGDIEDENEEERNLDYWLSRNIRQPIPRSTDISLDDYDGTIK
jgi:hypothetical protein